VDRRSLSLGATTPHPSKWSLDHDRDRGHVIVTRIRGRTLFGRGGQQASRTRNLHRCDRLKTRNTTWGAGPPPPSRPAGLLARVRALSPILSVLHLHSRPAFACVCPFRGMGAQRACESRPECGFRLELSQTALGRMVRGHLALVLVVLACSCSPSDSFSAPAPVFQRSLHLGRVRCAHFMLACFHAFMLACLHVSTA